MDRIRHASGPYTKLANQRHPFTAKLPVRRFEFSRLCSRPVPGQRDRVDSDFKLHHLQCAPPPAATAACQIVQSRRCLPNRAVATLLQRSGNVGCGKRSLYPTPGGANFEGSAMRPQVTPGPTRSLSFNHECRAAIAPTTELAAAGALQSRAIVTAGRICRSGPGLEGAEGALCAARTGSKWHHDARGSLSMLGGSQLRPSVASEAPCSLPRLRRTCVIRENGPSVRCLSAAARSALRPSRSPRGRIFSSFALPAELATLDSARSDALLGSPSFGSSIEPQ